VAEGAARAGGGLFDRLQQNRPPGNGPGNGDDN